MGHGQSPPCRGGAKGQGEERWLTWLRVSNAMLTDDEERAKSVRLGTFG